MLRCGITMFVVKIDDQNPPRKPADGLAVSCRATDPGPKQYYPVRNFAHNRGPTGGILMGILQ
jgi:hypothetical protein